MEEILKQHAESGIFSEVCELLKTVEVSGDESYRVEVFKSYSERGRLIFFARSYVKRPIPVEAKNYPGDVWASDSYKIDEQGYPDAEGALGGALEHLARRKGH